MLLQIVVLNNFSALMRTHETLHLSFCIRKYVVAVSVIIMYIVPDILLNYMAVGQSRY
jgi:hypothetical protein